MHSCEVCDTLAMRTSSVRQPVRQYRFPTRKLQTYSICENFSRPCRHAGCEMAMRCTRVPNLTPTKVPLCHRNKRLLIDVSAKASAQTQLVGAPPAEFDFRKETRSLTEKLIAQRYPELQDLAQSGVLVAVPRREDYVERRIDGYEEPELVFVVGTVHLSQTSAEAVTRVIECIKPDNVVVELCRTRSVAMYVNEGDSATSADTDAAKVRLSSLRKAVQNALSGSSSLPGLAIRLLADTLSARMQKQAGVRSGVDMRAARVAAESAGSQLVLGKHLFGCRSKLQYQKPPPESSEEAVPPNLTDWGDGDRPIEITWERAWDALSFRRKRQLLARLPGFLSRPLLEVDLRDVEGLHNDEAVEAMVRRLTQDFPEVASALLHERDLYLAWSLKRSKAVNGCKTVVGVMGRGHLAGVVYHLCQESSPLRFRDLVGTRRRPPTAPQGGRKMLPGWLTVIAGNVAVAAALQAAWQAISRQSAQP